MTDKKPRGRKRGFLTNGRGTFQLDICTPVGRIRRASGTKHLPTLNKVAAMLKEFATQEPLRFDLLKAVRDGKLAPLAVYNAHNLRTLDGLLDANQIPLLHKSLTDWLPVATGCKEKQRAAHRTAINHVTKSSRTGATVADLPDTLRKLRLQLAKDGHPAQFNRVRSSMQAFLRDTIGTDHRIYGSVSKIKKLEEEKQRTNNPQSVAAIVELARKINAKHIGALWGMALTGMGPGEFYGEWKIEGAGLHIDGTKRKARNRDIPLVMPERFTGATGDRALSVEYRSRKFAEALKLASDGTVQPYDLRRTYANWLEAAHVPRTRRQKYLGHAIGDVTDIYESHEVAGHLVADAQLLADFIRAGEKTTLTLETGKSAG
jgi:hypothetical protein